MCHEYLNCIPETVLIFVRSIDDVFFFLLFLSISAKLLDGVWLFAQIEHRNGQFTDNGAAAGSGAIVSGEFIIIVA